jgi:biotin synthase-related radical SAM superfamily protein
LVAGSVCLKEDQKNEHKSIETYGENPGFLPGVNTHAASSKKWNQKSMKPRKSCSKSLLERTYDDYLEFLEQERNYFKRYKVTVEVQIDRELDPAKFFEVVFTDSNGTQHSLREVLEVEEIPF